MAEIDLLRRYPKTDRENIRSERVKASEEGRIIA